MPKLNGFDQADHFFSHCHGNAKKPLEIYLFIDPLCAECFALDPILKKLLMQYGRFFTLRHILSGSLAALNTKHRKKPDHPETAWDSAMSRAGISCCGNADAEKLVTAPYLASLAIKSAELQGRKSGIRYLRKLQEVLFIEEQNVSDEAVLLEIARHVGLDEKEFLKDIHSPSAAKALQCDLKITSEMEVTEIPTLAFFNERVEDEGLKVTGHYPYDMYEQVLFEMLGDAPPASEPPPLDVFLYYFKFVGTHEISLVYNMTAEEVEKKMKQYVFSRKVVKVPVKYGTYWKYIG